MDLGRAARMNRCQKVGEKQVKKDKFCGTLKIDGMFLFKYTAFVDIVKVIIINSNRG